MVTDFSLESHLSALLFLGAVAELVTLLLGAVVAWFMHRVWLVKLCGGVPCWALRCMALCWRALRLPRTIWCWSGMRKSTSANSTAILPIQ